MQKVKLSKRQRQLMKLRYELLSAASALVGIIIIVIVMLIVKVQGGDSQEVQPTQHQQEVTEEIQTTERETDRGVQIEQVTEAPTIAYVYEWDAETEYLLAKIAMAEAEGEDIKGKALVMNVVLNRVNSSKFPNTVYEVIHQGKQFSPISNGRWDRVEPSDECWQALEMVKLGYDESNGALFFSSNSSKDSWHNIKLSLLFTHGNHQFYR